MYSIVVIFPHALCGKDNDMHEGYGNIPVLSVASYKVILYTYSLLYIVILQRNFL